MLTFSSIGKVCVTLIIKRFFIYHLFHNLIFDILKQKIAEYGSEGIISAKCDIYNYGVLLMENFSRKKPTDEKLIGEISLRNLVKESLPHVLTDVVDANW